MSEMTERVAKVLCHYPMGPSDTNSCCPEEMGKKRCQRQASASVRAMREPPKGFDKIVYHGEYADDAWRDAIDKMLK